MASATVLAVSDFDLTSLFSEMQSLHNNRFVAKMPQYRCQRRLGKAHIDSVLLQQRNNFNASPEIRTLVHSHATTTSF